ncbi:MAG: hypothetical protein ACRDCD_01895 [Mycoplasmoidaceae bacterium]
MNRKGKKELLNSWQNMSIEERENKLAELESSLSEKKFRKIVKSLQKIENSLKDDSNDNFEENENYEKSFEDTNSNENNDEESNEDSQLEEEKHEDISSEDEHVNEDKFFEASIDENLDDESLVDEEIWNDNDSSNVEDEVLSQNWVVDEDELNVETNFDDNVDLENQMFESENSKEYIPVDFNSLKTDSKKEQIGSNERAWNKNKDIIYSQEELIYRLSNSTNINDEEYRMLLISAQKKIEFIQLLIEKSRVKNAAYSYDFLNSMCWRVDKALKTFLAANKR